jgi:phenylacetate-CoA ligase
VDAMAVVALLRARAVLASRDRWSRDELLAHQARALTDLRAFALARSPFYREFHRGVEGAPLDGLPVLTKATLMRRFDELVTDRAIRLGDVETHLASAGPTDLFRGRYRVAVTGGTTGRRGVFLADRSEWTSVLASYARASDWAGVPAGLRHRLRVAVVSSRNPSHQSSIVGATLASPIVPTLRLDAADPLERTTEALNNFKPDSLVGYASILRALAKEQIAGRLAIAPRAVMSASEVLTDETRARIRAAFGIEPFNVYAATETAGVASECQNHRLHRYEDLVIAEIVDEADRPVPPGAFGAKLLVTVLYSRTLPLIRYELTDRVRATMETCPDGRPFALLEAIEGRAEDVLHLMGIRVHPNVFHSALEAVPVAAWQVVEETDGLLVLLAQPMAGVEDENVASRVRAALRQAGADGVHVRIKRVGTIPRTVLGKAPLVRALRHEVDEQSRAAARPSASDVDVSENVGR